MHLKRSDKEMEKRHAEREKMAKQVATVIPHDPFPARMIEADSKKEAASSKCPKCGAKLLDTGSCSGCGYKQEPKKQPFKEQWELMSNNVRQDYLDAGFKDPTKKEASAQEENLNRQAIHFASKTLKDLGLHNISLRAAEIGISDSVKGPRLDLIKMATIKLAASIPTSDGKRVATKPFFINLTFADGKFSLDSFEKNRQLFAVNKGSLAKVVAMEEERDAKAQSETDGKGSAGQKMHKKKHPKNFMEDPEVGFHRAEKEVDAQERKTPLTILKESLEEAKNDLANLEDSKDWQQQVSINRQKKELRRYIRDLEQGVKQREEMFPHEKQSSQDSPPLQSSEEEIDDDERNDGRYEGD